ncbi:MAG: helix-turn-helix transcriptional regulator [Anaerolineae bacterium]|nr:helix-turn-helix transcriptional regulator [Anaerolineae bacterium]
MGDLKICFGCRLAWLRKQRSLTQEGLAEAANVSVDFISLMERGRRAPSFDTLERLADTLGVTVTDLFTFDSER